MIKLKGSNDRNVDTPTEESSKVEVSLDELSENEIKEPEALESLERDYRG